MKLSGKLGVLLCGAVSLLLNSCSLSSGGKDDTIDYLPVQESRDGNWSFVDKDGNIKYADEFKEMPSAVIEGFFTVKENDSYTLYKADDKPTVVKDCEGLTSVGYMSDGLMPLTKKGERISVIGKSGDVKFTLEPVDGKEIVSCELGFNDGMLAFKTEDDLWGFVNKKGEVAVKPQYDFVYSFAEGKSIVVKKEDNKIAVIDKEGNTLFNFREGYKIILPKFVSGRLATQDSNGKIVFLNKDGEVDVKCPSKVNSIFDCNADYLVFRSEDGGVGVMNFDGEVVIRAKYDGIQLLPNDLFLCSNGEKITVRDSKDEEKYSLEDFKDALQIGGFRIGKDRNTFCLLDKEWKPIKNAEFHQIVVRVSDDYMVYTDYFNRDSIIAAVVGKVTDKGVGNYTLGESPAAHFSNPGEYGGSVVTCPSDLDQNGFRYSITSEVRFSQPMSKYSYESGSYNWNPNAELYMISLTIMADGGWGKEGAEALANAFRKKGFSDVDATKAGTESYVYYLKKGNLIVALTGLADGTSCKVGVSLDDADADQSLRQLIANFNGEDVAAADMAMVPDEVAVMDEDY